MASNEVNTVVLSKSSYDTMRGTNDRASMLLREIMDSTSIANDCKVSCLKYEYIKDKGIVSENRAPWSEYK